MYVDIVYGTVGDHFCINITINLLGRPRKVIQVSLLSIKHLYHTSRNLDRQSDGGCMCANHKADTVK